MHKEMVQFASPVLAALFQKCTEDKDRCIVCSVPRDWPQCKAEAKDAWLSWLWYVYLPYTGAAAGGKILGKTREVLLLAEKLGSQTGVMERIIGQTWGTMSTLVELMHPGEASWAPIIWIDQPGDALYSWQVFDGALGRECRFYQTGAMCVPHVLRLSPAAAEEFRAAYLSVLADALSLVPHFNGEDLSKVVHTVLALLSCEVAAGHSDLMDQVSTTCSKCPEFLRAVILGSLQNGSYADFSNIPLPDAVLTQITCSPERSRPSCAQAEVSLMFAPLQTTSSEESSFTRAESSPLTLLLEQSDISNLLNTP